MFRRSVPSIALPLVDSHLAAHVPVHELRRIERRGTTLQIARGQQVMQEARVGRECMVILGGAFTVSRGDQLIAELGPGDFVGEIALLTNRPRNASVVATEDSTVCVFNPREFSALMLECPTIASHLRAVAEERSVAA